MLLSRLTDRVRRSKVRRPDVSAGVVRRPRIMQHIVERHAVLSLIVAPAGFGKTTVAAEWADQEPRTAWLNADAEDASLPHFWTHLRAALRDVAPDVGELVDAAFDAPFQTSASHLGRLLADELLDAEPPIRLVIDDVHLVPASETHAFLDGLLEHAPPGFQLLLTARSEPPLTLSRLRLRGTIVELRGSDLLFTADETRTLVARTGAHRDAATVAHTAAVLQQRTHGWAAGLHLGAVAADRATTAAVAPRVPGTTQCRLLDVLLDEVLSGRSPGERTALARAALPDAFKTPLLAALVSGNPGDQIAREAVDFALGADLCHASLQLGGEWLEFHPLIREGLQRWLQRETSPQDLADLHVRAAQWFEVAEMPDAAVGHWLAAGEIEIATILVEREIQPAFNREDWPAVARWLALLPDDLTTSRLPLLLARGWIAYLRGQAAQLQSIRTLVREIATPGTLEEGADPVAQAELDLMELCTVLPVQIDPERALAILRTILDRLPLTQHFQRGLAQAMYGVALQASGHGDEAVALLGQCAESARIGVGPIRALVALQAIHWQAGNLARVHSTARATHELGARHQLRLTTGWGHYFLGNVLYERDDPEGALAEYAVVVRDYAFANLMALREAFFGLALASLAAGRAGESTQALQRARDILFDAEVVEQLPLLDAYEAYLALLQGELPRALQWARANAFSIDSAPLYFLIHPVVIRAAILCAAGEGESLAEAAVQLQEARDRATSRNFLGPLVRIDALQAIVHVRRGEHEAGAAAMRRSLAAGIPQGVTRTYLDLLPNFATDLYQLATVVEFPDVLLLGMERHFIAATTREAPSFSLPPVETLTERERDVLAALMDRLSYKEVAERLFIAPATVKRHVSSIYRKLGVSGRSEAIRVAQELGWRR